MMFKKTTVAVMSLCASGVVYAADDTLNIGVIATISGAGAGWGQAVQHGAELAAKEVNEAGGLDVSGKKYKVNVITYDDKYQAGEAVTAVNRLVHQDKVKFIVGPVGSAAAVAIKPVTEKNGVVMSTMAFSEKILNAQSPYTFRANVTTVEFAQAQINWVAKKHGIKKIGSFFPNDETGLQVSKDVEKAYGNAGVELVGKEFYERDRVDFVPLLTRLMGLDVDAIELNINAPSSAGLIVKQARDLGFEGLFIRTGGPATQEIVNVAGKESAEGILVHTLVDPDYAPTKAYIELHKANYAQAMNGFSPSFYDTTRMIFEAIRQAQTIEDTQAVVGKLENIKDFDGAAGKLSWTGKSTYGIDHQISTPFYVAEVVNGQEVIRAKCTISGGCLDN
ncbi:MAG: ABC transporter substrate-binding protein [Castellaniella sp.]|uniref:ABC transporter substrate-binding protein n=1 Tax=Castellaniella sp. TaxID=1955812 RepID=UPI003C7237B4